MDASIYAFGDELTKIAREAKPITRRRAGRAVKGALAIGIGSGLGAGAGALIARALDPKIRNVGPAGRKGLMIGMAALGAGAGLGSQLLKRRYLDYIEGDD